MLTLEILMAQMPW